MFLTRSEYDRGVNTFSPEGRLFQVEYAMEAIKLGSTAVGVKTKEGVVLAVEKRVTSPLLDPSSIEKIMEIDSHIGAAMSGLTADARTLIAHGRSETQQHRFNYNEAMGVEACTQSLCDLALRFGEGGEDSMSRPFGVALLLAGNDKKKGPCLYHTDPSGTYTEYNAKAIGSASEGAQVRRTRLRFAEGSARHPTRGARARGGADATDARSSHGPRCAQAALKEKYSADMSLADAETLALSVLRQVMEEKVRRSPQGVEPLGTEAG